MVWSARRHTGTPTVVYANTATKDSAPQSQQSSSCEAVEDGTGESSMCPDEPLSAAQHLETTQVSFMEPPSCSTPRHSGASKRIRKRKRDMDLDALREMEEDDRREAREQRQFLFQQLAEHEERAAAAREREYMLRRQEAEESRRQLAVFQQGLLAMFGALFKTRSQPEPPPLD